MRKNVGIVLIGLSGFLLFAGLLAVTWAPGKSEKTPLDVNSTTILSGEVAKLDPATGELVPNPVIATSITQADSNASDDDVVVFVSTTCVVADQDDPPPCVEASDPRLITASSEVFATDRVTALSVNDDKYLPAGTPTTEGIRNKFPFDSEKKSYPYWDGVLGAAVPAEFDRTESVEGLETYVYKVTIADADIEIADGVAGTYDDVKEIFVEPRTGSIVNQTDDQQRYLADGSTALDLQLAFTDDQITKSVADTEDNRGTLTLITKTVPLIGFVGGSLALLAGLLLAVRGQQGPPAPTRSSRRQPVGVS